MATHSRILAWEIPWTEEPGGLQSMGSQRIGRDWAPSTGKRSWKCGKLKASCLRGDLRMWKKAWSLPQDLLRHAWKECPPEPSVGRTPTGSWRYPAGFCPLLCWRLCLRRTNSSLLWASQAPLVLDNAWDRNGKMPSGCVWDGTTSLAAGLSFLWVPTAAEADAGGDQSGPWGRSYRSPLGPLTMAEGDWVCYPDQRPDHTWGL